MDSFLVPFYSLSLPLNYIVFKPVDEDITPARSNNLKWRGREYRLGLSSFLSSSTLRKLREASSDVINERRQARLRAANSPRAKGG